MLLDIEMPEITGLDALRILRKSVLRSGAPGNHGDGEEARVKTLLRRSIWAPTITLPSPSTSPWP